MFGNQSGRSKLAVSQFRVGVYVTPPVDDLVFNTSCCHIRIAAQIGMSRQVYRNQGGQ